MCAELVYYRAVFEDAEQNKTKSMPILTVDGEASLGNLTTTSFQKIANNVTEITLLTIGYLIPERSNFLTK